MFDYEYYEYEHIDDEVISMKIYHNYLLFFICCVFISYFIFQHLSLLSSLCINTIDAFQRLWLHYEILPST